MEAFEKALTPIQKLHVLQHAYYLGGNRLRWKPKAGDLYTSCRADLELYQVVDVSGGKVKTIRVGQEVISEWDEAGFLTEGFGTNRIHVPEWIFKITD